ncbi:MAG TPA: class I SAM-dependent methyltransferase [Syntrophales bacterium]|nr:class I SAM-dependent methyltransferase [Syntrophales bacterium]
MKPVDMDEIYRSRSPEGIPWVSDKPPAALVALVDSEAVKPCTAVDLGCGTGNYAIYLAGRGFQVTGIDLSPTAIGIAREKAKGRGVQCDFIVADVLGDLRPVGRTFDFAYDWELLHHIFPEQRSAYVANVHGLLNPLGCYLSVCFSEKSPQFGGSGKYRKTPLGTVLYFSSEDELRELFETHFRIIELKTIEIPGKRALHLAVYAFMVKK